jgi:hypothetical protein
VVGATAGAGPVARCMAATAAAATTEPTTTTGGTAVRCAVSRTVPIATLRTGPAPGAIPEVTEPGTSRRTLRPALAARGWGHVQRAERQTLLAGVGATVATGATSDRRWEDPPTER